MPDLFWLCLIMILIMLGFLVTDLLHVLIALLDNDPPVE